MGNGYMLHPGLLGAGTGMQPPMQRPMPMLHPQAAQTMGQPGGILGDFMKQLQTMRQENPQALMALGAGLMQGNPGAGFAAMGDAMGQYREGMAKRQEQQRQANLTTRFLMNKGMSAEEAEAAAANPEILSSLLKQTAGDRQGLMNAGNGNIFDPNTREWITPPGGREGFRQASKEEAAAYGATAGQFGPDGRFYPINAPSGMSIESDGQGGFRVAQGPGVQNKPFTEAQSKDNVYATRARGALPTINEYEQNLTSLGDRALNMDPTGLVRGPMQSPDFQVAQTAGDEFLQAILRKDTGAAITAQEQILYGKTYLPQPGDGPEVIAYKRQARERAVAALEAGMSPAQIIAQERAIMRSGGNAPFSPGTQQQAPAPGGGVIDYRDFFRSN